MKKLKFKVIAFVLLLSTILFAGCKSSSSSDPSPSSPTITSKYYFTAKINGTQVTYEDGKSLYASGIGENISNNNCSEYATMMNVMSIKSRIHVGIFTTQFDKDSPNTSRLAMYKLGTYKYGITESATDGLTETDGAYVQYYDENGVRWATDLGTGVQTASKFEITEHIANTDGYSQKISTITFTCTLYNASGQSMTLTDGKYRGRTVAMPH